jgi:formate-dependent nitrite reductase cytochrome c552 subunit
MSYLGLAHVRREGSPMHPDDISNEEEMSDEQYLRQLQAYKDANSSSEDYKSCIRDYLLPRLK